MNRPKSPSGTLTGIACWLISWLLSYTYVVPLLSLFPAAIFGFVAQLLTPVLFSTDTMAAAVISGTALAAVILICLVDVWRKSAITRKGLLRWFLLFALMVHPFGFFVWWARDPLIDGQKIFGIIDTYPFTSLGFLTLGMLIDLTRFLAGRQNAPAQARS